MVEEKGMSINCEEFEAAKEAAKELSKQGGKSTNDTLSLDVHAISFLQESGLKETNAQPKYDYTYCEETQSYKLKTITAKIVKIRYNKEFHEEIPADTVCGVILDTTNFYAEQGGQVSDIGYFGQNGDEVFTVDDCQVKAGYVMHYGKSLNDLKVGDEVELMPENGYRYAVMNNHTSTHVLNHALREALGKPADQKGSLVAVDRLRFDFVCSKALTIKQVTDTENISNQIINENQIVYDQLVSLETALKITGIRAMFGETYPDPVRVVSLGVPVDELLKDGTDEGLKKSVELCGGTHLKSTGHAKKLIVTSEEAIAKGIRRMICVTGDAAFKAQKTAAKIETDFQVFKKETEEGLKTSDKIKTIQSSQKEIANYTKTIDAATIGYVKRDDLRKQVAALKKLVDNEDKKIKAEKQKNCIAQAEKISSELDKPYVVLRMDEACGNGKVLSQVLKIFQKQAPDAAVMLISCDNDNGRIAVSSQVPKSKVDKLKANKWVGEIQTVIEGKGGGKELNAMASGTNVKGADEAVELAEQFAKCLL